MQENQNTKTQENKSEPVKKQTPPSKKKKSPNEDFKRKYFDYYDDIKISDRQIYLIMPIAD